jgi:cytochrome c-type biogenesis protein CcmH
MDRRNFLKGLAVSCAAGALYTHGVSAQEDTRNTTGTMDQGAAKSVRLPPKPNATPLLTDAERDELEHQLRCQCGCSLDVYTCRTTDFTCEVSPAMHRDVMALIAGGYNAEEIKAAFQDVYGERVFMAPVKEGFNWVGYILPFAVLGGGAVFVSALLKRWSRPAAATATTSPLPDQIDATPEELDRLHQAIRSDDE